MSKIDLTHMSNGRTPWRRHLQLRRAPMQKAAISDAKSLRHAADIAEPPTHIQGWQRQEALHRLAVFCAWLDRQLQHPVHAEGKIGHFRKVHVFKWLTYSINYKNRCITSGASINGCYEPTGAEIEMGRPLFSHLWIFPILKNLDLACNGQIDLFLDEAEVNDIAQWIAVTAYRLLLRNPLFQRLRRVTLPQYFKLPPLIYSIALASRPRPVGPLIDSGTVNHVWRNEKAFQQVEKENPQLLPLLLAFIEQIPAGDGIKAKDPVMALKNVFRAFGVSEASWRYLVRYGARLFKIPWEISRGQPHFEVAIRYIKALQFAGLPPPPPPSVAKAFLHGYNGHREDDARIYEHFLGGIDPAVLRTGLWEADQRRQAGVVEGFAEEFLGVCWWAENFPGSLDSNQVKAGWAWLVRQWQAEGEMQAMLEGIDPLCWLTRIDAYRAGHLAVIPINSAVDLVHESIAMRNCLQTRMVECACGDFEVFSVRDGRTGKRKGCIGFCFDSKGLPIIEDMKGFANTPPTGEIRQIAQDLLEKLRDAHWGY